MRIRSYSKRELAMMYFPNLTPHAATNKLARWIGYSNELTTRLRDLGYSPRRNYYTPKEVETIFFCLGAPQSLKWHHIASVDVQDVVTLPRESQLLKYPTLLEYNYNMHIINLNLCSSVTCSPPKVGGVPRRGEEVCTASKGNISYAAVHTPPSLRDTPSGEQVTALHRKGRESSES